VMPQGLIDHLLLFCPKTGDEKASVRSSLVNANRGLDLRRQVLFNLLRARAGKDGNDVAAARALIAKKSLVELLPWTFIEEWMADVFGMDAALRVPRFFEGQRAQDVIDPALHLLD